MKFGKDLNNTKALCGRAPHGACELNWEVGALALALWIASEWFGLSWYPALVVLAIWIGGAIVITGIFSWASHGENRLKSNDDLPNVNPYSIDPYAEYKQKKDNGR